jgi:hypothetical protein
VALVNPFVSPKNQKEKKMFHLYQFGLGESVCFPRKSKE